MRNWFYRIIVGFNLAIILFLSIWINASSLTQSDIQEKFDQSNVYLKSLLKENPDDPSILTNLGHLHWQYGSVDSAYSYLRKALKKNSNLDQALFDRGMIHWYRGSPEKALSFMEKAYQLDTLNYSFACRYALLLSRSTDNHKKRKAAEIFQNIECSQDSNWVGRCYQAIYAAETGKENARDQLLEAIKFPGCKSIAVLALAQYLMQRDDFDTACAFVQKGLTNIETNEALLFVPPFSEFIMPAEVKKLLTDLLPGAKGNYIAAFWRNLDPTPISPTNERMVEHYRRVDYAKKHFNLDRGTQLDERARIYIQYGEPDERYTSPSTQYAKPNETWTYFSKFPDLCFDFVEFGSGLFRIVNDLSAALLMPFNYDMYGLDGEYQRTLQNIYNERAHLGGPYAQIAMEEIGPENMFAQIEQFTRPRRMAQSSAPLMFYEVEFNATPLDFPFRWAAFKGENSKSLFEVVYGIPKESLSFKSSPEGIAQSNIDFSVTITDFYQNPIINSKKRIIIDQKEYQGSEFKIHLGRWRCQLPPGTYPIAISAKTEDQKQFGLYVDTLQVANFDQSKLVISSIEFSLNIQDFPNIEHLKNEEEKCKILPYPFPQVLRATPIFVYYEIYNLTTDKTGQTNYQINYSVESYPPKKALFERMLSNENQKTTITSTENRTGKLRDDIVCLSLDLQNLPVGPTLLRITVKDINADSQADSQIVFNLR